MARLGQVHFIVVYECDGVPYGRYYERFGWLARWKARRLARDPDYENVRVEAR